MRAFLTHSPGAPIILGECPKPTAAKGEILVRMQAIGLNPVDYKLLKNGNPAWHYPHIPGVDGAGIIEAVGEGVTLTPGMAVMFHANLTRPGTFAEHTVTSAHSVTVLPPGFDPVLAAALPCAGLTAYQGVYRKLHLQAGQRILILGAAGGVGSFAVQLAHHLGATVIATASAHNHQFLKDLGADYTIDYHSEDIVARSHEITAGRGVDAVFDLVGKDSATAALPAIAFGGALAAVVAAPDLEAYRKRGGAISLHGIALGGAHLSGDLLAQRDLAIMGQELLQLVIAGTIKPVIHQVYDFAELPAALGKLQQGHNRGKLLVRVA
jgi:NADPH:quinone reductase